uniref:non-specific serine/threonine protein kinase n=1 Tax=Manihot esculenta TaxID=3983 RepID=A0A2C9U613_MANES
MLNVELLLSSFSSYANSSSGFYNASAGQDPDVVYGLFLCRGDLSPEICQDCVNFATQDIIHRCPTQKMGITWYDECFIRYSNEYIFSTVAVKPFAYQMIISRTTFRLHNASHSQLVAAISVTAANAAFSPSGYKINFATGEFEAGPSEKLHNILQCTPDILSSDCYKCLLKGIGELPNLKIVKQGGIFLSSCIIRFNLIPVNPSPQDPRAPAQPPSLPVPTDNKTGRADVAREKAAWIIVGSSLSTILGILFFSFCVYTLWKRKSEKNAVNIEQIIIEDDGQTTILVNNFHQMPLYTLQIATQFFSKENKLGQGGFGPVYKNLQGTLEDGREIAIKRRSRTSRQGLDEFMNEVKLIANLQHRNLVRLLGYCLEQNGKLLVYEYMPNKNSNKSFELNWQRRLHIINGIGRGLLYLHEDSRLKIIHMDMKTSNILLDNDLNPKISDFGMSRIFEENQSEANTKKIAGTYFYS